MRDPARETGSSKELFPNTLKTWIGARLLEGPGGRPTLNHYVMSVYREPLEIYVRGSSFRHLGDATELVQGFFADRLAKTGFLEAWPQSGLRLRRWLMNALLFYLRETSRKRVRDGQLEPMNEEAFDPVDRGPERSVDQAFARSLVREALERTREACQSDGLSQHFEIFFEHYAEQRSYPTIANRLGLEVIRARLLSRTAKRRFQKTLHDLLARDGIRSTEANEEIRLLMELLDG